MTKDLNLEKSNKPNTPPSINTLPSEVLAHIFQFVLIPYTQPCFLERDRYSDYPNYPETLLRVCSHWRQVALESPSLWSRIDIVLSNPASQKILERAKIFLERAGQSLLDLRIFDQPIRSRRPFFSRSNDEFSNEDGDDGMDFEEDDSEGDSEGDFEDESDGDPDDESDGHSDGDSELDSEGGSEGDSDNSSDLSNSNSKPPAKLDPLAFVSSLPARTPIRSIEFVVSSSRTYSSSCIPILRHCFEKSLPNTLTKLVLRVEACHGAQFLIPSSQDSEAAWLSITSVHISGGIHPSWESNAFKGLTDLRLVRTGYRSISESQFVNILKSSPKLQILQFHIAINKPSPLDTPVEAIHLDDLEVLDVIENHLSGAEFKALVRWIVLGQKPLRLFIWYPLGSDSVKNFFRRANVAELHVRLHGNTTQLLEQLIDLLPRLRVLAVDGCGGDFSPKSAVDRNSPSSRIAQIDTLHLQYCGAQIVSLQKMAQARSIRKLTMWSSHIRRGRYGGVSHEEILALCPNVKVLKRREFTPIEQWLKSIG